VVVTALLKNLGEVKDFATQWMSTYNHNRTNIALGESSPKQYLPWPHNVSASENLANGGDNP